MLGTSDKALDPSSQLKGLITAGGDSRAAALTAAAARLRDLVIEPFAPGTRFEHGVLGCYERVGGLISVVEGLGPGDEALVIAHEIAHHDLHEDPVTTVTSIEPRAGAKGGAARPDGYSGRERHEVEAEAFAHEFLCPADALRAEILAGGSPAAIAATLGLPLVTVMCQAVRAALLPPLAAPAPGVRRCVGLDPTQRAAAEWSGGPVLVSAGPGTGKTATLVARVLHLLSRGADPGRKVEEKDGPPPTTPIVSEVRSSLGPTV